VRISDRLASQPIAWCCIILGCDADELAGGTFSHTGWQWSSADFVHWSLDSYVFPNSSTPGAEWMAHTAAADGVCWATDAASRGGQYYFYLSVGSTAIGVVSGPTPKGPWHDPLGQALLANGSSYSPSTEIRDPAVYADPADGSYYIVFGTFNYYIAKLNEDMISLAEQPRYIHVNNIWAGQNGPNRTDDKPFLHSHTQPARGEVPAAPRYYLSYGAFYAISDSPYGPYEFVGTFIAPAKIAPDFRMPIDPEQPWYKQLDYKDRHGSFMTLHNQW
jgi:arabinoxylan arabinofuranohydrolase